MKPPSRPRFPIKLFLVGAVAAIPSFLLFGARPSSDRLVVYVGVAIDVVVVCIALLAWQIAGGKNAPQEVRNKIANIIEAVGVLSFGYIATFVTLYFLF